MPRVLVPVGLDDSGCNHGLRELNFARTGYLQKLIRYGLTPVMLTPYCTPLMLEDLYSLCDGVLLMGGDDVNARLYGEENHPSNEVAHEKRDEVEREIIERSIADHKPLLAICRGCQLLSVVTGGSLYQHLPEVFPGEAHRAEESSPNGPESAPLCHDVFIDANSRAHQLTGSTTVRTNSSHHQAIKNVGRGLKVVGRSAAGVVELIEHEDPNYFCFGIQSHPEVVEQSFFEEFFKAFSKEIMGMGERR